MLAVEKQNNYLVVYNDNIKDLEDNNITFIFPIKEYSVGFPDTYNLDDVIPNSFILINRILDDKGIEKLKKDLKNFNKNIIGICFTDLGIINLIKNLGLKLIYMQNHNTTNYKSVNYYLNYVDSLIVSTDITREEIIKILDNTNKKLVVPYFMLVDVLYSRRNLLTNYTQEFNLKYKNMMELKESNSNTDFLAVENEYGTVIYPKKFIDYRSIKHNNILFYYINPLGLSKNELKDILNGKKFLNSNLGFLETPTYYDLKEVPK